MQLHPIFKTTALHSITLFMVCFIVLLLTMVPTVYTLDSAELTVGAARLGIVHAPSYPLYLMILHLFIQLPLGEVAFSANLFSALCLALTAPCLYGLLLELVHDPWIALLGALACVWSHYVWIAGLFAEVYAPQILTVALCGWAIVQLQRAPGVLSYRKALLVGFLVGVMVATAPSSILFGPGIVLTFRLLRLPWKPSLLAGSVSVLVFAAAAAYLPIRYTAGVDYNLLGRYAADGRFQPVDLNSLHQIFWVFRGGQFDSFFLPNGLIPFHQIAETATWFWGNYLGLGIIAGFIGLAEMATKHPKLLASWLVLFLPYTYFYTTYGASDRHTMFGPSYLLWTIPLAFGMRWALEKNSKRLRMAVCLLLPAILLVVNFSLLDSSDDDGMRKYTDTMLDNAPANAHIFGVWWEIVPLEYGYYVENQRPDVRLYNLFLFGSPELDTYIARHFDPADPLAAHPVIVLKSARSRLNDCYELIPMEINPKLYDYTEGEIGAYRVVRGAKSCEN